MKKENKKPQIKTKTLNSQNQSKQKASSTSNNNQSFLTKKNTNKYNKITTENKLFPNITRAMNKKHLTTRVTTAKKIDSTNSSLYLSTANTIIDSNSITKTSIKNPNIENKHKHLRSNSINEETLKTKYTKKTNCEKIIEVVEEIIELIDNRQFIKYILNKYKNDLISDDVMFNYVKSVRNKANNLNNDFNNDFNNFNINNENKNFFVFNRSCIRTNCYKNLFENIFNSMLEIRNFDIELYNKMKIIKLNNKKLEKKNKSSKISRKNSTNKNINNNEKKILKHRSIKQNLNDIEFLKKFHFQTNNDYYSIISIKNENEEKKHSNSKNKHHRHHRHKHHKSKEKKIFDFNKNESEDEIIENDNDITINENNNNNEFNLIEKKIFKSSIKFNKKKSMFNNNKSCNNNNNNKLKFNFNNENVVDSSENEN